MARPAQLASRLDESKYETVLASNGAFGGQFALSSTKTEHIDSISSDRFLEALAKGQPLYDEKTLAAYVDSDSELFDRVNPDVVVGDFRLSLSISARVAKIPYISLSNVYWSPYAKQRYPVPRLPMTERLGATIAQPIFDLVRPAVFALHTRPLNALRRRFGMPTLGLDLRKTYTDADLTLYADVPGLVDTTPLPSNHRYIGPILWSPNITPPDWWGEIDCSKPVIYMTPGSSGNLGDIQALALALAKLPATVLVATAGQSSTDTSTPGVLMQDFLPGREVVSIADLVVCNGGSPTTAQALAAGVPVIGIPSNLDQFLNMNGIASAGVGVMLRSEQVTPDKLRASAERVLRERQFRDRAEEIQRTIESTNSASLFEQALNDVQ
jgi:UDP:flavonoid glycosyltransferase YjiC (YdhE family)